MTDILVGGKPHNSADYADSTAPMLIPAGKYRAVLENVKIVDNKTGSKSASMQFKILTGQYANQKVFTSFVIGGCSQKALDITGSFIKGLKTATNCLGNTYEEMYNKAMVIVVKVESSGQYTNSKVQRCISLKDKEAQGVV